MQSSTSINLELSFIYIGCLTKAKEISLPYYLPIAWGRAIGFIPFPSLLELREMQCISSGIWTHVVVSIFYDDNQFTTDTSKNIGRYFVLILRFVRLRICWLYYIQRGKTPQQQKKVLMHLCYRDILSVIGPETLVNVRPYRGNIDACLKKWISYLWK